MEDRPVAYMTKYIRPEPFPHLLEHDLSQPLSGLYRAQYGVAQVLRDTSGTPALVVERVNYSSAGEMVDCDVEYWRHDAINIASVAELVERP